MTSGSGALPDDYRDEHASIVFETPPESSGALVVTVGGTIESMSARELWSRTHEAIQSGLARVVMDLGDIVHMEGPALSTVTALVKSAREAGGGLVLCNVPNRTREYLELTGLLQFIPTTESREEAIGLVSRPEVLAEEHARMIREAQEAAQARRSSNARTAGAPPPRRSAPRQRPGKRSKRAMRRDDAVSRRRFRRHSRRREITPAMQIDAHLLEQLRSWLSHMDTMLEKLPEQEIVNFSRSFEFEVYRRVFEHLGLEGDAAQGSAAGSVSVPGDIVADIRFLLHTLEKKTRLLPEEAREAWTGSDQRALWKKLRAGFAGR
jgi:stage II sporulation protein AA (anti-sigma F factor antagonist)